MSQQGSVEYGCCNETKPKGIIQKMTNGTKAVATSKFSWGTVIGALLMALAQSNFVLDFIKTPLDAVFVSEEEFAEFKNSLDLTPQEPTPADPQKPSTPNEGSGDSGETDWRPE